MDLRKPFNKSNVKGWTKEYKVSVREDVKEGELLRRGQLYLNHQSKVEDTGHMKIRFGRGKGEEGG